MDKELKITKYVNLGARIRLMRFLLLDTIAQASTLYTTKEIAPLIAAKEKVSKFCSDAEQRFYNDYPDFGEDCVFYGAVFAEPESNKDQQMMVRMYLLLGSFAEGIADALMLYEKDADQ